MSGNDMKTWCCGTSLSTGVKVMAVVNLVYSLGLIVGEVVLYFQDGIRGVGEMNPEFAESGLDTMVFIHIQHQHPTLPNNPNGTQEMGSDKSDNRTIFSIPLLQLLVSLVWISTWIFSILFSLFLYHAAVHRNRRHCAIWFYYRLVVLIFRIIFLMIYIIAGYPIIPKIPVIILFLIGFYSLWVVNKFLDELRLHQDSPSVK